MSLSTCVTTCSAQHLVEIGHMRSILRISRRGLETLYHEVALRRSKPTYTIAGPSTFLFRALPVLQPPLLILSRIHETIARRRERIQLRVQLSRNLSPTHVRKRIVLPSTPQGLPSIFRQTYPRGPCTSRASSAPAVQAPRASSAKVKASPAQARSSVTHSLPSQYRGRVL
jgi:hypothetical protein